MSEEFLFSKDLDKINKALVSVHLHKHDARLQKHTVYVFEDSQFKAAD